MSFSNAYTPKNAGLLGIAEGLNQGLQAFNQARGQATKDDMEKQKFNLDLAGKGYRVNPDTNQLELTDEGQAQHKLGLLKNQSDLASYDPNSQANIGLTEVNKGLLKKAGLNNVDLTGMSAEQQKNYLNPQIDAATKFATIDANKQTARDAKLAEQQKQTLLRITPLLEGARGNPAAAQAERDLYAAKKFSSLANLKGDPNDLNPMQVQLAATEVAKMASGGVPSIHELQGLNPKTIPMSLAATAQKYVNHPLAANAGEFIKSLQEYTDQLSNDAKKVITEKYGRIINTNKGNLSKADYAALKEQYLDRFNHPGSDDQPQGLIGNGQKSQLDDMQRASLLDAWNKAKGNGNAQPIR